jgi:hypothetical protein
MDLTESFIAHGTSVDLVQIAFEKLAAAARRGSRERVSGPFSVSLDLMPPMTSLQRMRP